MLICELAAGDYELDWETTMTRRQRLPLEVARMEAEHRIEHVKSAGGCWVP